MNDAKILKALVVDNEEVVRDFLNRFLNLKGLEVKAVEDGYKAIDATKQEGFDMVFVEIKLSGMDGLQTFRELKKINPRTSYAMMSSDDIDSRLEEAQKEGAEAFFQKPFDIERITQFIDKVATKRRA